MSSSPDLFSIDGNLLSVDLDEGVYSRDSVLRTAYWFTDRCYLYVARPGPGLFRIRFKSKAPNSEHAQEFLGDIAGEFLNSLLDHQIRHDIESETGRVRELLVAKAFAEAGVLEDTPPGEPGDAIDNAHQHESGLVQIEPIS
jgi:His-Xaa-Ser system protein HxsD